MGILQMVMSAVAAALDSYNPKRSTRFNTDDSAHLSKTLSSAGNRRTWTMSFWTKLTGGGTYDVNPVFAGGFSGSGGTQNGFDIKFSADQELHVSNQINNAYTWNLATEAVFRDYSSWYHVVVAHDTTQVTEADRVKIYVNGEQVTSFTSSNSTYPSLNFQSNANKALPQRLGSADGGGSVYLPSSAYLADVHFIDGFQLDATSFAETNILTGQWVPKEYTGGYSVVESTELLYNVNTSDNGFDSSSTSRTYDAASRTFETYSTPQTADPGGYGANSAHVYKSPDGASITWAISTDTTDRYIWTSSDGTNWSSSGSTYDTDGGTPINVTAVWIALAGGGSSSNVTVTTTSSGYGTPSEHKNSFHLAMDPAESGTIYSDGKSAQTGHASHPIEKIFDGDISTYGMTANSNGDSSDIDVSLTGLDSGKTVRFYGYRNTNAGTLTFNSGAVSLPTGPGNKAWVTAANTTNGSSDSFSMNVNPGSSSSDDLSIYSVEVDGKILVDHTAIGHDISGQNNHWYENNLVADAGTTVWSSYLSLTGATAWHADPYGKDACFNGLVGNSTAEYGQSQGGTNPNSITFTPSGGITYTSSVEVYIINNANTISVNGGTAQTISANQWVTVASGSGTLTTLEFERPSTSGASFCGIRIDGSILTDSQHSDLLADVPGAPYNNSLYGGGNYCTLNPLAQSGDYSNGNLKVATGASTNPGTIAVSSGKWYYEATAIIANNTNELIVGIIDPSQVSGSNYVGKTLLGWGYSQKGTYYNNDSGQTNHFPTYTDGDVIGVAFDLDANTLTYYKNNTAQTAESITAGTYTPAVSGAGEANDGTVAVNFGQRPFAYTPPTGYKALNVFNLTATIVDPSDHFDVGLDTGANILTTALGLTDGADFVWIKDRANNSTNHILFNRINDSNMDGDPHMRSNENHTEATCGSYSAQQGNSVAWVWNAGSSTVTNTVGTIESEVRANTSAGFSIASFSGTGSIGNVGHGLNSQPSFIVVKRKNGANDWETYHKEAAGATGIGATHYAKLNETDPFTTTGSTSRWNDTSPTSSVFTVGTSSNVNDSSGTYTAYIWSEVAGYSKFGSYTGNNDADGPFIYCGFKPALLIIKKTNATDGWMMYDNKREPTNLNDNRLEANSDNDEYENGVVGLDFLSNGFKLRTSDDDTNNGSYVFCAWAEAPFSYANAR